MNRHLNISNFILISKFGAKITLHLQVQSFVCLFFSLAFQVIMEFEYSKNHKSLASLFAFIDIERNLDYRMSSYNKGYHHNKKPNYRTNMNILNPNLLFLTKLCICQLFFISTAFNFIRWHWTQHTKNFLSLKIWNGNTNSLAFSLLITIVTISLDISLTIWDYSNLR